MKPEPEEFNLQVLWKAAFPVGTEWEQLDSVYKHDWDFTNLEREFEEGGKFHDIGDDNQVYLFAITELQCYDLFPVLVAVVAPRPPSTMMAFKKLMKREVEMVPIEQLKMDWMPYIPSHGNKTCLPQIFVLHCHSMASLKELKEASGIEFEYCMPYVMNPVVEKKDFEDSTGTEVKIMFPQDPDPPVIEIFDWKYDGLEDFTDQQLKAGLLVHKKEEFMEFVREQVRQGKQQYEEAWNERMEDLNYHEGELFYDNMRKYKIYPLETPNTLRILNKLSYITYYYGHADEVL